MSTPRLQLYVPDLGENAGRIPAAPSQIPEPIPVQYRLREGLDEEGREVTDAVLVWFNEDAARCRWCKPGECTFRPTATGIGTCTVRREGGLGPAILPLPG